MKWGKLRPGFVWRGLVGLVVAPIIGIGLAIATQNWLPSGGWYFVIAAPICMGGAWFYAWYLRTGG